MKQLSLILASLALASCATIPQIPTAPVEVADKTVLDESAALAIELAYQAAATAALTANRAGIVPAAVKPRLAAADRKAYAAVLAVRAAYDAGNATSYATAAVTARTAVSDLLAAIRS